MDRTIKSFKGYGKVDEAEQQAFHKKTRRRLILISVSLLLLIAILIGVAVSTTLHSRRPSDSESTTTTPSQSLKSVCSVTRYPDTCFSSLQSNSTSSDPAKIFLLSLRAAISELSNLVSVPSTHISESSKAGGGGIVTKALLDCADLFSDSVDRLNDAISTADGAGDVKLLSSSTAGDLRTWLTAALTDQETCVDGLAEINGTEEIVAEIRSAMNRSSELVSNSLAIVTKLSEIVANFKIPIHRRLLGEGHRPRVRVYDERFPAWMGAGERRMLQVETKPAPNAVVAKDGTGNYTTIAAAVAAAPLKSNKRYVIYVKEGKYVENVVMNKSIWNVMIYGDGMTKTVVSGSLNFIDGIPTFSTATFIVQGKGFIAKDMRFENTAGASKHQAVAFRSGSDMSVFHRCMFDGYQDSLYAHSNRQFYLTCTITGTIDFIFGNAAVIFQDCTINPRQPMPNQFNTITAQGKKDPSENSGICIQKCNITPLDDSLKATTYLGRPWKEFSTTVIMQSSIGPFLSPMGWIEWVQGVDPPSTIFYGEYLNSGPGADVSGRVKWAGYQASISMDEASKYTVDRFIDGSSWLGDAQVTYQSSL